MNRLRASEDRSRQALSAERDKVERELQHIVNAIKQGVPALTLKDELSTLEQRKAEIEDGLATIPAPQPRFHPNLAELYRRRVANLADALNDEGTRAEAAEALRNLIGEIRLVPEDGELRIKLYGELAALIDLANEHPRRNATGVQVTLVAGAGFEPATFRL